MRLPVSLFVIVAVVIVGAWSWLGAPVVMPPSPLAAGEKLYCVSYAPFREGQSPLGSATQIPRQQIDDDLARLATTTGCVRTYSTQDGLDQVPEVAAKHGLQVIQGIWLSSNARRNRQEIDRALALAKQYPQTVRSMVVGNEVLLRGEMTVEGLIAAIREVKAAVSVPVTYADVWEFWLRHRELYPAVDFVTIHILPYWEDFPIAADLAGAHVAAIRNRVAAAFPNKEILIGETGWPSAGRMREGARPSPADQARVLHDVLTAAKEGGYRVNVIEAFDQPWKRALEGTVGGHWGLYDGESRSPKFAWGEPVSNHPFWMIQAAGGVAFAAIIFLAAWTARRADVVPPSRWVLVGLLAAVSGVVIGLAAEGALLESLGIGGWTRSALMVAAALGAPAIAAAALVRQSAPFSFAVLLGGREAPVRSTLGMAATAALVLTVGLAIQAALGLVFDPRYKDFPYAGLTGPILAFAMLLFSAPRPKREFGLAERSAAVTLGLSAVYIAFNESFANWQSLWFSGLLLVLVVTLLRLSGVRKQG